MINKNFKRLFILLLGFIVLSSTCQAETVSVNFDNETAGAPAKLFSSFVGNWYIAKDGANTVYAVDERDYVSRYCGLRQKPCTANAMRSFWII